MLHGTAITTTAWFGRFGNTGRPGADRGREQRNSFHATAIGDADLVSGRNKLPGQRSADTARPDDSDFHRYTVNPPSTFQFAPVTYPDSGPAR